MVKRPASEGAPEEAATLTERDLSEIAEVIGKDRFASSLGARIEILEPGHCRATLTVREDMTNFLGMTHGASHARKRPSTENASGSREAKGAERRLPRLSNYCSRHWRTTGLPIADRLGRCA